MGQQPAFAFEPATVAGQRPVGADDAMTGHDHADGVGAVGEPDGPHGAGAPDARREAGVAQRCTGRNRAQRSPHLALERRPSGAGGDRLQAVEVALEVGGERVADARGSVTLGELRLALELQSQQALEPRFVLAPVEGAQVALGIGHEHRGPDRRDQSVEQKRLRCDSGHLSLSTPGGAPSLHADGTTSSPSRPSGLLLANLSPHGAQREGPPLWITCVAGVASAFQACSKGRKTVEKPRPAALSRAHSDI